ncbi:P-loop containing nucleoside triphosphate hydrolase [Syntrophomonas zehnderi OL-4]|uniref:p-loop containing nucleoside triphosphate hydrolase n=1 Tax=Syntrophomonas zehnderi OL-4 TaxID=690567 RepID=A0A0E4C9J7_9FIRM|nr:DNA polymerase III subunit delta' [Syntrophomonas zehnderi]CFY01191.1 P-loop containing nucleoside triphosphate hydrolase [Syntrophomonas zehnderi OL-4]
MKYFKDIVGHDKIIAVLEKALQKGRLSHAYLFLGPAGVGKFTTALAMAQAVILTGDPQGEAYWREGVHPDFKLVKKMDSKTLLGIEQITQEIEPWLALKPYRADQRVVIIKDAHLLSLPAANALLKTLEEPPDYAVIILAADENNLLETIVSRCQIMNFSSLSEQDIKNHFLTQGMDEEKALNLARLGQGSIADALLFAEEEWEEYWFIAENILTSLADGSTYQVFAAAEKMEKHPEIMVSLLETILRDILIFQQTHDPDRLLMDRNLSLCQNFKLLDPYRLRPAMSSINSLKKHYKGAVNSLLLNINISYELLDALR